MRLAFAACAVLGAGCFSKPDRPNGSSTDDSGAPMSDGSTDAPGRHFGAFSTPAPMSFADGEVNEQGPALSPDELELYYYADSKVGSTAELRFASRLTKNDPWDISTTVAFDDPNTSDSDPTVMSDGTTLYFWNTQTLRRLTRSTTNAAWAITGGTQVPPSGPFDIGGDGLLMAAQDHAQGSSTSGIVQYRRPSLDSNQWGQSSELVPNDQTAADVVPTISEDGLEMFWEHHYNGGSFDIKIFHATRDSIDVSFGPGAPLDFGGGVFGDPELSANGEDLFFVKDTSHFHIFVAHRERLD